MKNQHFSPQDGSQNELNRPKSLPRGNIFPVRFAPRFCIDFWSVLDPKMAPKIDQKIDQKSPCETSLPQDRSMTAQVRPKTAPRPLQDHPRPPQDRPPIRFGYLFVPFWSPNRPKTLQSLLAKPTDKQMN